MPIFPLTSTGPIFCQSDTPLFLVEGLSRILT